MYYIDMAIQPADRNAEAHDNIGKKHDELVALLQSTLAIGDYEELFFKVLLELKFSPDDLNMVANCYDTIIEEIYG
jgi:hypothetical protein